MNNKELFLDGYLDRLTAQFPQSGNPAENRNLAFEIFAIAAVLDKPFQEVFDTMLVKGSKDGGIDGIWFEDHGDYYDMHVLQIKNKRSLSPNEIDKFRNDYRDIFPQGNRVNRPNIENLQPFIDEYRQLSGANYIIQPKLYFVFNGLKDDPGYANNKPAFDIYHQPDTDFRIIDSDDLYAKVASLTKQRRNEVRFTFHPEKSNISVLDTQGLYSYSIENIRAANFRIPAIEICELIKQEMRANGGTYNLLFQENIRSFLGTSVRPNRRMQDTLDDRGKAIYFSFLNNGITIICDSLTIPRSPQDERYLLPVVNPQIVNGLQTSMVLYRNYVANRDKLRNVFVNVRVYETKDPDLIEQITDATNTQSPINYRDKVSNKGFNTLVKAVFDNAGIQYITKRGESLSPTKGRTYPDAVNSDTVIKYWYATFFEEPERAKSSVASVLQDVYDATTADEHPLKKLFDGSVNAPVYQQFLAAFRIYRHIQRQKPDYLFDYEFLAYADELMSYGVYKAIGAELSAYSDTNRLAQAYKTALMTIRQIVNEDRRQHEEQGRVFSYTVYFKKAKCRVDYNTNQNIIESDGLIDSLLHIR